MLDLEVNDAMLDLDNVRSSWKLSDEEKRKAILSFMTE
jgi:hypothetical protein